MWRLHPGPCRECGFMWQNHREMFIRTREKGGRAERHRADGRGPRIESRAPTCLEKHDSTLVTNVVLVPACLGPNLGLALQAV